MNILKITKTTLQPNVLTQVLEVLKAGGVIVFPTDTAYGLGVDALSEDAIGKIFIIKKRVQKPLPVIVSDYKMLESVAELNPLGLKLAKKYWPAPLTIIFKKKDSVPAALTLGLSTVGVKMPDSKIALKLVKEFGHPLTSTSANISGTQNNYTVDDVLKQFRDQEARPDLILDAGSLSEVPVSTVVDTSEGKIKILREGPVTISP